MSEATTPQTIDPTGEPTAPPTVLDIESARAAIQGDLDKRIREADMLIGQILSERKLRLGVQPSINVLENGILQYAGQIILVPME